jgi:hypothetical protein
MPEQSVIVWDLETVPDLAAAARMLDMGNASEAEIREALGSGFPKHPLHKIACIGALIATRQPEGWRMDALGAPHIGERPDPRASPGPRVRPTDTHHPKHDNSLGFYVVPLKGGREP